MTAFRVVIPVRYASTRLPGKPLLDFQGKTIVEHVYANACASQARSVLIATDDERIKDAANHFNAPVCMTSNTHQSGTDRIAEAVDQQGWQDDEIIVNLQGDEPQMPAANIAQVAELLSNHPSASIATLCSRICSKEQYDDPNIVKVVKDDDGRALYFSRSSLPHIADVSDEVLQTTEVFRHIGIYAYRVSYLKSFVEMQPSKLETIERLEQLRALQAGHQIMIDECVQLPGVGVDTSDDYEKLIATD